MFSLAFFEFYGDSQLDGHGVVFLQLSITYLVQVYKEEHWGLCAVLCGK